MGRRFDKVKKNIRMCTRIECSKWWESSKTLERLFWGAVVAYLMFFVYWIASETRTPLDRSDEWPVDYYKDSHEEPSKQAEPEKWLKLQEDSHLAHQEPSKQKKPSEPPKKVQKRHITFDFENPGTGKDGTIIIDQLPDAKK